MKKYRKHFVQTFKKYFDGNFQGDFWKNLRRIMETSNNFIKKL